MRIWHVKFFGSRVIFWNNAPQFFSFFFKQGLTSAGRNSALKTPYPPLPYIFWKLWTCSFTWNHPIYDIPIQRRRRRDSATPVNSDFEGPKSRLHSKISWMSARDHIIISNYRRPMDAILFPKPTFVQNSGLDARKDHKHDKSFHYLCHCTPLKYVQTL